MLYLYFDVDCQSRQVLERMLDQGFDGSRSHRYPLLGQVSVDGAACYAVILSKMVAEDSSNDCYYYYWYALYVLEDFGLDLVR